MSATAPRINGRAPRVAPLEDSQPGLADALLAFHAEAPKLSTNATGQIQNRTYRYVTLDGVLDDVEPLLLKHGLLWTAKVTLADGGRDAVHYCMTHVPSGESDEWDGPLPCVDPGPQALGSAITYMRRYTLVAYLNLAPGEDDDGAAASRPDPRAPHMREQNRNTGATAPIDRYAQAEAAHAALALAQPQAAPARPSERQLSEAQTRLLRARSKDLTSQQFAWVLAGVLGVQRPDEPDAKRWVDREVDRLPARLVDAVLEGIASCPPF